MRRNKQLPLDILEMPNYSLAEAVRYFHIPFPTVEYWTKSSHALVKLGTGRMLSFKNMVELYVLEGLRHIHNLKVRAIRAAVEDLLEHEESSHPLADYELRTMEGKYLLFLKDGTIVNFQGREQKLKRSIAAPGMSRALSEILMMWANSKSSGAGAA